ncbi:MAG: hypothetical protein ACWGNV_13600, partial [Bacteroidales bacterium]
MFWGIRLPAGTVKREGIIFLSCFSVVLILNLLRIIVVKAPAFELVKLLPAVLIVALVMYGAAVILRVLYAGMARFWNRKNAEK